MPRGHPTPAGKWSGSRMKVVLTADVWCVIRCTSEKCWLIFVFLSLGNMLGMFNLRLKLSGANRNRLFDFYSGSPPSTPSDP